MDDTGIFLGPNHFVIPPKQKWIGDTYDNRVVDSTLYPTRFVGNRKFWIKMQILRKNDPCKVVQALRRDDSQRGTRINTVKRLNLTYHSAELLTSYHRSEWNFLDTFRTHSLKSGCAASLRQATDLYTPVPSARHHTPQQHSLAILGINLKGDMEQNHIPKRSHPTK